LINSEAQVYRLGFLFASNRCQNSFLPLRPKKVINTAFKSLLSLSLPCFPSFSSLFFLYPIPLAFRLILRAEQNHKNKVKSPQKRSKTKPRDHEVAA
jgi:hypothetical protein